MAEHVEYFATERQLRIYAQDVLSVQEGFKGREIRWR